MARPARALAQSFMHPGVAVAYRHRPPYPDAVFRTLLELIKDRPRRVLELGAGEGAIARHLAPAVDELDAVEASPAMIVAGRRRPGGDEPNLRWLMGAAESCELEGPYALVVAGASFHWFDFTRTLARLPPVLTDNAVLALVDHDLSAVPWRDELDGVIRRFSRSPNYDPDFDLVRALEATGHYTPLGAVATDPAPFRQRVSDYVEHFHSTASLARNVMSKGEAEFFDRQVREIVEPYADDGELALQVQATVRWGRPR